MEAIQLFDKAEVAGIRRDGAGNLIGLATVARTGIYDYAGYELGKPDQKLIRVYRPPDEVFSRDAMRSLASVPFTDNHPPVLVDTSNWKEYAKGETSSEDIVRDGEAIKVPFILRDESAIKSVDDGKHELSPGYTAIIDWTAGQTPDGKAYDAVARTIRYNHVAIVDRARGGSSCRIGDEEPGDKVVSTKIILVDGLSVETTEQGERAILKLSDERKAAREEADTLRTKLADAEKAKATLEGEKAALTTQLKDATDPAALQSAAEKRAKLCDQAKAIAPKIVTDGKTDAEIRKEVVIAKLGDAANDFDDNAIAGAFATLALGVKTGDKGKDQLTDALRSTTLSDEDGAKIVENHSKARQSMLDRFRTASRPAEAKE